MTINKTVNQEGKLSVKVKSVFRPGSFELDIALFIPEVYDAAKEVYDAAKETLTYLYEEVIPYRSPPLFCINVYRNLLSLIKKLAGKKNPDESHVRGLIKKIAPNDQNMQKVVLDMHRQI